MRGLAPIKERDEARSADPARDTHSKYKGANNYQYRMKNEAKGYNGGKENHKVNLNDRHYLQKRGADIIAMPQAYIPNANSPKYNNGYGLR